MIDWNYQDTRTILVQRKQIDHFSTMELWFHHNERLFQHNKRSFQQNERSFQNNERNDRLTQQMGRNNRFNTTERNNRFNTMEQNDPFNATKRKSNSI